MYCTHSPPGALEEHPGLSGPALQMSSPGTARLDPHYHSLQSSSLLTASPYSSSLASLGTKKKKKKTTAACQMKFAFNCCFGVTVVRLSACRAEVTAAADSYLRGCWRATGGARLLPFSSGSISSRLGSTMWLKPPSRQREERDSFPVRAFKIRQSTTNERQHYSCLVRKSGKGNVRIKDGTSVIASLN